MTTSADGPAYREHVEQAPVGIFEVNQHGEYVFVNTAACEMVGYSEEELLDMSIADVLPMADEPREIPPFRELSETGELRFEGEILHKDGQSLDVILEAVDLEDDRYVAYVQDISAEKNYQRELRDAKNRFQTLFEEAPEAIAIHDSDGNIREVNRQEVADLGYSMEELSAMKVWDIESGMSRQTAQELWDQMDVGETRKVEGRHERKDGSTYPAEVWANKVEIDGKVRFLVFVRDITERKEREEQLRREKERLDEFASLVSHDLRNLLNVAQGRIELAREECDSDHLAPAANGVDRSLELLENLLDLARAGQEIGEMEPVDLSELVETCWITVETADAAVVIENDSTVLADRNRLRQLLENLFHNAVEHGGQDVTVRVGTLPDGFYIEDTGSGIPASDREVVFETDYSEDPDGAGFGLAIVEQIADAHGWKIRITEGADGGARFEFTGVSPDPD